MTVQQVKIPQVDIAEDNAFFLQNIRLASIPVPCLILMAWTIQNPYCGKHKILVIAADERYSN